MKVLVIGGGASGLIASIYASKNNDVTILEKDSQIGKKLLVTGNGKCNYWNENQDISNYNTNNIDILKHILIDENKKEILDLFDRIGIIPRIKNGYYYPYSNQATSIQTGLIKEIKNKDVNIITDCEVLDIDYDKCFKIKTNKGIYEADKVIISTGSYASKKQVKNIGYDIAKKFNHKIIEPKPGLVSLIAEGNFFKDWKGIRCDVELTYDENIEIGEAQLTDYGISGVCVFNLSSKIINNLDKNNILKINFVPFLNIKTNNELIAFLNKRNKLMENRTISELLDGFLNYKLVNTILKLSNIKKDDYFDNLSDLQKDNLAHNLLNFELKIIKPNDFSFAQTCSGGIPLDEINPNTMESLKQNGLYFTGEILDVDGKCGGYNLEFAFVSGLIAGDNID